MAVEEPTANSARVLMPFGFTDKSAHGVVVPKPDSPVFATIKCVVVAKLAVVEDIEKRFKVFDGVDDANIERSANGEDVPIPTRPPWSTTKVV